MVTQRRNRIFRNRLVGKGPRILKLKKRNSASQLFLLPVLGSFLSKLVR